MSAINQAALHADLTLLTEQYDSRWAIHENGAWSIYEEGRKEPIFRSYKATQWEALEEYKLKCLDLLARQRLMEMVGLSIADAMTPEGAMLEKLMTGLPGGSNG